MGKLRQENLTWHHIVPVWWSKNLMVKHGGIRGLGETRASMSEVVGRKEHLWTGYMAGTVF